MRTRIHEQELKSLHKQLAKTQTQLNEARKVITLYENRGTSPKEQSEMATSAQKSSLIALAAACTAMAAAAQALAASFDETTPAPAEPAKPADPAPAKPAKVKPAAAAKPAETPAPAAVAAAPAAAPAETPAPAAVAATPAAAPATNGAAPDLITQCRTAAKSYAGVYGREGLKEILGKYTQGTLADVAAEKLPELLKELS